MGTIKRGAAASGRKWEQTCYWAGVRSRFWKPRRGKFLNAATTNRMWKCLIFSVTMGMSLLTSVAINAWKWHLSKFIHKLHLHCVSRPRQTNCYRRSNKHHSIHGLAKEQLPLFLPWQLTGTQSFLQAETLKLWKLFTLPLDSFAPGAGFCEYSFLAVRKLQPSRKTQKWFNSNTIEVWSDHTITHPYRIQFRKPACRSHLSYLLDV